MELDKEELGKIAHEASKRWSAYPRDWENVDLDEKEAHREIGAAIASHILKDQQHYKEVLDMVDAVLSSHERYQRVYSSSHSPDRVRNILDEYRRSAARTEEKLLNFKEDMTVWLRAMGMNLDSVRLADTHKEKDARLRGAIAIIESAIQRLKDDHDGMCSIHGHRLDLFRSNYPVQHLVNRIAQLEAELEKLKPAGPKPEENPFDEVVL